MSREASNHRTSSEFDEWLDRVQQTAGDNEGSPGATKNCSENTSKFLERQFSLVPFITRV